MDSTSSHTNFLRQLNTIAAERMQCCEKNKNASGQIADKHIWFGPTVRSIVAELTLGDASMADVVANTQIIPALFQPPALTTISALPNQFWFWNMVFFATMLTEDGLPFSRSVVHTAIGAVKKANPEIDVTGWLK